MTREYNNVRTYIEKGFDAWAAGTSDDPDIQEGCLFGAVCDMLDVLGLDLKAILALVHPALLHFAGARAGGWQISPEEWERQMRDYGWNTPMPHREMFDAIINTFGKERLLALRAHALLIAIIKRDRRSDLSLEKDERRSLCEHALAIEKIKSDVLRDLLQ